MACIENDSYRYVYFCHENPITVTVTDSVRKY